MSPPARHRAPEPSSPDNESAVRVAERTTPAPAATPSVSSGAARERLEGKLRLGRQVLAGLPSADDRARLLHVALMRRDEALLDGVLSALGVTPSASIPPPPR